MNLSALLPVYEKDVPVYLNECLDSILHQTVKPDEVIVVLDGPVPDALEQVIEAFDNLLNIVQVRIPENKGLGNALREGVIVASGELIARVDADDISDRFRFEKQLNEFESDSTLDIVGTYIDEFEDDIAIIKAQRVVPAEHNEIVKFAKLRCPVNHPSVMFKKSAVIQAGNYQDFFHLEDYYLWIRMMMNDLKFKNIPEPLVHMRVGNGMYGRRGGFEYYVSKVKLRIEFFELKFINIKELFAALVMISGNFFLPVRVREMVYTKFLRREIHE